MYLKRLLLLLFAPLCLAKSSSSNTSLTDALASQNATLSMLNSLLASQPAIVRTLGSLSNITLLAPSNDALSRFVSDNPGATADSGLVAAVLTYHVLNGTSYASSLLAQKGPNLIPTLLTNATYANVTGGQRVESIVDGGNVVFVSGGGVKSTVTTPNVNFTGGTIHIIDRVLSLPVGDAQALKPANLTDLAGALAETNLVSAVSDMADVTIFAPTNAAFSTSNISDDALAGILKYHVVPGAVVYSNMISDGMDATTAQGSPLQFRIADDGGVFVNGAKIVTPNVLVANGVVHVIDSVLNPQNSTATPNPTMSASSGATSGATSSTTATPTTGAGAAVRPAGVMGAAALFGGAAALLINV